MGRRFGGQKKNGTDAAPFDKRRAEVRAVPRADLRAVVCAECRDYSRAAVCTETFTEIFAPMQKHLQMHTRSTQVLTIVMKAQ